MTSYNSTTSGDAHVGAPTELPVAGNLFARLALSGFVVVAALFLFLAPNARLASPLILAAAPLLGGIAACRNAVTGSRIHRDVWLLFTASGLIASTALILDALAGGTALTVLAQLAHVTWTALVLVACIRLLYTSGAPMLESVVDITIVMAAATAAVLHWTASGHLLAIASTPAMGAALLLALPPIFALASLMILAPSATTRSGSLTGFAAFGLATLIWFVSSAGLNEGPLVSGALIIAAWAALAFGAMQGQRDAGALTAASSSGVVRLQHSIGPGVGVVMAATLVHCAIGHPMHAPIAITLALLSSLLALRMSTLLEATRQHSEARRELAQKRALVEVSTALAGSTDLHSTLELVTTWTCRLLNTQAAAIELLREDDQTLVIQAVVGLPDSVIGMQFPVDGSFTGWVVQKREPRATADASTDPFMSGDSRNLLGRSPTAAAPMRCREQVLGALSCVGTRAFTADDLELLQALADQAALAIENARLFEQVHALSVTDPLTNLSNRRQLERDLAREFAAARRGRQLVAVMFDLNGFKDYNDRHGHLAGDQALRAFADALATETRAMNLAVRYGGDEFLVLLADADLDGTAVFIQRIRERFSEAIAKLGVEGLGFAAGIAEYQPAMRDATELIAAADRALYQIKRAST